MSDAPTDRAACDERWIEVPAPQGGVWMVAIGTLDAEVIAPPAVALPPVDDPEGLGSWRVGQWPLDEHGWLARRPDQPVTSHVVTTADVLARLAHMHHPWIREVMRLQLAQHEAFATPQTGGLTDEERQRHATQTLHNLRQELWVAFPDEDWYKRSVHDILSSPTPMSIFSPRSMASRVHTPQRQRSTVRGRFIVAARCGRSAPPAARSICATTRA